MGEREFIAFMAGLTASTALGIDVMLPALGEIRATFGLPADSTTASWSVTLYFLGLGSAQLVFGPLADRFGRKPALWAGLGLYALGAAGAALAPSLEFLLVSRLLWGIGAASPRAISLTIIRDRHVGDRMARVLALVMTVFMIAPILGPGIGELLLLSGSWRWVFGFSLVTAVVLALWLLRLEETLNPRHRLTLDLRRLGAAFRAVARQRATLGYTVALSWSLGAFVAYLAGSELLFDDVYDRSGQFALLFGVGAAAMAVAALSSARAIRILGAQRVLHRTVVCYLAVATALTVVSLLGGGVPEFWLWWALLTVLNSLHVIITPICNSLAMVPMGQIAGTASAVIGAFSLIVGSMLASLTNRFLLDSVTPLSLSYLGYGSLAAICIFAAGRQRQRPAGASAG